MTFLIHWTCACFIQIGETWTSCPIPSYRAKHLMTCWREWMSHQSSIQDNGIPVAKPSRCMYAPILLQYPQDKSGSPHPHSNVSGPWTNWFTSLLAWLKLLETNKITCIQKHLAWCGQTSQHPSQTMSQASIHMTWQLPRWHRPPETWRKAPSWKPSSQQQISSSRQSAWEEKWAWPLKSTPQTEFRVETTIV